MPGTAVIVAPFDQPRWLRLALRAWARQSVQRERVVVAGDGRGPQRRAVVTIGGAEHVWLPHEPDRFGKCRAVNAAVRRARELGCDHLLFTDGDCLPARDLLERHLAAWRPGRVVAGGVIRLSREASNALTAAAVGAFRFPPGGTPAHALPRPMGRLIDALILRRTPRNGGDS